MRRCVGYSILITSPLIGLRRYMSLNTVLLVHLDLLAAIAIIFVIPFVNNKGMFINY